MWVTTGNEKENMDLKEQGGIRGGIERDMM